MDVVPSGHIHNNIDMKPMAFPMIMIYINCGLSPIYVHSLLSTNKVLLGNVVCCARLAHLSAFTCAVGNPQNSSDQPVGSEAVEKWCGSGKFKDVPITVFRFEKLLGGF